MYQFVMKGGYLMYPIMFCSVLTLAILFERLFALRRSRIIPEKFIIEVSDLVRQQRMEDAMTKCRMNDSSIARVLMAGISRHDKSRAQVKEAIEDVGRLEAATLERFLAVLGTIAGIAPLLGLLGTVTGMIKAFNVISQAGIGNPQMLAGGISEALITTAAGLTVAIPAFVFYKLLRYRVDKRVLRMERVSMEVLDLLDQDGGRG
ncbi:MAG: MotA/TolQ/ExbB proton channel family protein [Deltaproteobacteria bacterium]|nr:MotA/TolQ/ExbB proton channel family protein [Deltaproteobacteria bacterium]